MDASSSDPFQVLGLPRDCGEEEARARYLKLVRQHPPERDPERFREIRAAYEQVKDPLVIASALVSMPDAGDPPKWEDVIEEEAHNPPPLDLNLMFSLGNRPTNAGPGETCDPNGKGQNG